MGLKMKFDEFTQTKTKESFSRKKAHKHIEVDMSTPGFEIDEKYSLSIYHFNLQYKAGDVKSYHALHRSSMRPLLRFYDRHPKWALSLEIQGHYIEFMKKFYPEDFAMFLKLNQRDQLELVSVHYSDQIYLAYPYRDLSESIKINDEIYAKLGLNRSGIWFGQENLFGPGIYHRVMESHNYQTALLNNHYIWHHKHYTPEERRPPYWKFPEIDHDRINFITNYGQSYENPDQKIRINQSFSYWGDAELAFGATPYFSFLARPIEQYTKNLLKYTALEKAGVKIVKVSDYINRVKELKLPPKEGPILTDATWNTRYYQGVYLWMGQYRFPWEKDAEIRSMTYRTRAHLLVVEKLVEWALRQGFPHPYRLKLWLKYAWRHMMLAEVSDSTGQSPARIEVRYSIEECNAVENYLFMLLKEIKGKYQFPGFYIDPMNSNANPFSDEPCPNEELGEKVSLDTIQSLFPSPITILRAHLKKTKCVVHKVNDEFGAENRHYILDLIFKPKYYTPLWQRILSFAREGEKKPEFTQLYDIHLGNYAGILFPLIEDVVSCSPACMEDELKSHHISEFDFDRTSLPLPNGLIGLGKNLYVIKHNCYGDTHIACTLDFTTNPRTAGFMVMNPPSDALYLWRYSIFKGEPEEALELAMNINVFPTRKI
jgi:hypothetical protein